jgi:hypothetical protein
MPIRHLRIVSKLPVLNSLQDSSNPINLEVIPKGLGERFHDVRKLYQEQTNINYRNDHSSELMYNDYSIRIDLVDELKERFYNKELFVKFDPYNSKDHWSSFINNGISKSNIEMVNQCLNVGKVFSIDSEDAFEWLMGDWYAQGFYEGYYESYADSIQSDFKPSKGSVYSIASDILVHIKTIKELIDEITLDSFNDSNVICPHLLTQLGTWEGRFIKAWDIVLSNIDDFNSAVIRILVSRKKKWPDYCQIGALFVQGFIKQSKDGVISYNEEVFENPNQLTKHLVEFVLKGKFVEKNVYPYINGTLTGFEKSFYFDETKRENVIAYCKEHGMRIVNDLSRNPFNSH